jgi:hypothetical protein
MILLSVAATALMSIFMAGSLPGDEAADYSAAGRQGRLMGLVVRTRITCINARQQDGGPQGWRAYNFERSA